MRRQWPAEYAIFGVFFFESSVIGHWIPRIPDIKDTLSLSDASLGVALLALPAGTLVGLAVSGRIVDRLGLRRACRTLLPIWAMLFLLPGLASTFPQLLLALALCGTAIGLIETAMNTEAARLESASGRRLMSRAHGFWSLGTMAGALLGGYIAQQGVSVREHYLVVMPVIAVLGYLAATALPTITQSNALMEDVPPETDKGNDPLFKFPEAALLLLCIMPLGIMAVEGAFIDWSALFMREVLEASPMLSGVTYAIFALVMTVVRLSGDHLAARFGDLLIVRWSAVAATLGILLFALAPSAAVAMLAAALAGAGVAIVFPLAVTACANRPSTRSATDNVAALNMIAFSAFLLAPPFVGFVSEALNLRWALLLLAPASLVTFLLSREIDR